MPKYNYTCHTCDSSFEVRLSYSEVDTTQPSCPDCGGSNCERGLSRVAMQVERNGGSDYRLSRGDLESAISMSNAMGGHSHSSGGCGGCSGGSCSTCGH